MKSLAAGIVGIAVAGALGLGVFNLATTGCPLGTCASEETADAGSATLPVSLDQNAAASKDACCMAGEADAAEIVLAANAGEGACEGEKACDGMDKACDMSMASECAGEMASGCTEEMAAACDKTAENCEKGEACCKAMAADEAPATENAGG